MDRYISDEKCAGKETVPFYRYYKTILRIAVSLAGGFLFGLCLFSGLSFLAGVQVYYETSESMKPVIKRGDLLLVKRYKNYKPGDIIVFRSDNLPGEKNRSISGQSGQAISITHRIVKKVQDGYLTKGDANEQEDPYVIKQDDIRGKVEGRVAWYGFFCHLLQKNGWILLVFAVVIICTLF
ncbi:MAG: signal peptidase I [Eubacterium sp.]|nr:signal peptidase I [Eubacterium sp.]